MLFIVCPIALLFANIGLHKLSLDHMQQQNVDWVINHAYPGSRMIRADGLIADFSAGDSVYVIVTVTFESSAPFEDIKAWYILHPEGGRAGGDLDSFPQAGLENLSEYSHLPGITYRVSYVDGDSCAFYDPCEEASHQIH